MKHNKALVVKDNALVEKARYRLSVNEQRLILTLISRIGPDDTNFQRYTFGIRDLYDLLRVSSQNKAVRRRTLKNILRSLQRNIIEIVTRHPDHGGERLMMPAWIESPDFDWDKGKITLRVSEYLKPYLLQLKNKFTRYSLAEVARFKCAHSFRFIEFCKNHEPRQKFHDEIIKGRYVNIRVYGLSELRLVLGIPEKIYPKLANFRKRVLEASQKEVNEKTSSYFDFEMIKDPADRRKTKAVRLIIFGAKVEEESENPAPDGVSPSSSELNSRDKALRERMLSLGVSARMADAAIGSRHGRGDIHVALEAIEEYQQNRKLRYPNGILRRALLDGWTSKREISRRTEDEKTAGKLAAIDAEKAIRKGLEDRKKKKEKLDEAESERRMEEYQNKMDQQAVEYKQTVDKIDFILNLMDMFQELDEEQQKTVRAAIEARISAGEDFKEVYDVAGRLIFGFLNPLWNVLSDD